MRKLYIRDRASSQSATVIHDERAESCYLLTGKWGLRHDALSLYTMQGELLAELKQLTLGITPRFALYQNRQRVGTMGKALGFVREVVYIRGLNWMVMGSAQSNCYRVYRNRRLVFTMGPVENTGGMYTEINVANRADEPLAILVACVLDHWARRGKKAPMRLPIRHKKQTDLGLSYGITVDDGHKLKQIN